MSDLSKYGGNFLNYADGEFDRFEGGESYSFVGVTGLDFQVGCSVGVFPSLTGQILIEVSDSEQVKVRREGDEVVVTHKDVSSNNVVINNYGGRSVSVSNVSGNMSIINGVVYVDGKPIDQAQSSPAKPTPKIRVFIPSGLSLRADLNGVGVFASKVAFSKATVKVSGSSTVGLAAGSLKLKVSGQGENYCVVQGGNLDVSISGQGSARVKGVFESVEASVSGMGNIQTEGACEGDYEASVSGMGGISHSGGVRGRIRKSKTGMGSISV